MSAHNNGDRFENRNENNISRPTEDSSHRFYSSIDTTSQQHYNQQSRNEQLNGKSQADVQKHFGGCTIVDERSAQPGHSNTANEGHPLLSRLTKGEAAQQHHANRGALLDRLNNEHVDHNQFAPAQQRNPQFESQQQQSRTAEPVHEVNTNDMFRAAANIFGASKRFEPISQQAPQRQETHYFNGEQLQQQGFHSQMRGNQTNNDVHYNNYPHKNGNFTSYAR